MVEEDPLDVLFVSGEEIDRAILSKTLFEYVRLDESGRIFPKTLFFEQSNRNKLIILLLSRKAIALKTGIEEVASPSELSKLTDLPEGSIRPTLRLLVDARLAVEEKHKYRLLSPALQRCAAALLAEKETPTVETHKEKKPQQTRVSMRSVIEEAINRGELSEGKAVREIYNMVLQRRPGTVYNAVYKVVLDLVHNKILYRNLKGDTWFYRSVNK